jgi:hypothetical protein
VALARSGSSAAAGRHARRDVQPERSGAGQGRGNSGVLINGITREVPWKSLSKYFRPHPPEVFIELQDHDNPVRYRNIRVRALGERDKP